MEISVFEKLIKTQDYIIRNKVYNKLQVYNDKEKLLGDRMSFFLPQLATLAIFEKN